MNEYIHDDYQSFIFIDREQTVDERINRILLERLKDHQVIVQELYDSIETIIEDRLEAKLCEREKTSLAKQLQHWATQEKKLLQEELMEWLNNEKEKLSDWLDNQMKLTQLMIQTEKTELKKQQENFLHEITVSEVRLRNELLRRSYIGGTNLTFPFISEHYRQPT
jgi:hypothetical protein